MDKKVCIYHSKEKNEHQSSKLEKLRNFNFTKQINIEPSLKNTNLSFDDDKDNKNESEIFLNRKKGRNDESLNPIRIFLILI